MSVLSEAGDGVAREDAKAGNEEEVRDVAGDQLRVTEGLVTVLPLRRRVRAGVSVRLGQSCSEESSDVTPD